VMRPTVIGPAMAVEPRMGPVDDPTHGRPMIAVMARVPVDDSPDHGPVVIGRIPVDDPPDVRAVIVGRVIGPVHHDPADVGAVIAVAVTPPAISDRVVAVPVAMAEAHADAESTGLRGFGRGHYGSAGGRHSSDSELKSIHLK
jgi:hypothetical protein